MTILAGLSPAGALIVRPGEPKVLNISLAEADGTTPQNLQGRTFVLIVRRSSRSAPLFTFPAELSDDELYVSVLMTADQATTIYDAGGNIALSYDIIELIDDAPISRFSARVAVEVGSDLPGNAEPVWAQLPYSEAMLRPDAMVVTERGARGDGTPAIEAAATALAAAADAVAQVGDAITELGEFTSEKSAELDEALSGLGAATDAAQVVVDQQAANLATVAAAVTATGQDRTATLAAATQAGTAAGTATGAATQSQTAKTASETASTQSGAYRDQAVTARDQVVAAIAVTPGNIQTNLATPTVPPSGIASGSQYWAAIADGIQLYLNTAGTGAPVSPAVVQPQKSAVDAVAAKLATNILNDGASEILAEVRDANGRRTWVSTRALDGGPSDYAKARLREAFPALPEEVSGTDELYSLRDANGRRTWVSARTLDGGPTAFSVAMMRAALAPYFGPNAADPEALLFTGRGDSMMQSSYGGGTSIPAKLSALLGIDVSNDAVSGTSPIEMTIKAATTYPLLTIPSGQINTDSTAQAVTWNLATGNNFSGDAQPNRVYSGTIRGVQHNLTYNTTTGALTISRFGAGSAVPVASPVAFIPDVSGEHIKRKEIIWTGRNGTDLALNYAPIERHVAWLRRKAIPFIILSVTNRSTESPGDSDYTARVALNAQIQALCPYEYVNMQGRLVREGLSLAGLTPTTQDNTAIAQEKVPPQLQFDGLHLTDAGRTAATIITKDELQIRGML